MRPCGAEASRLRARGLGVREGEVCAQLGPHRSHRDLWRSVPVRARIPTPAAGRERGLVRIVMRHDHHGDD